MFTQSAGRSFSSPKVLVELHRDKGDSTAAHKGARDRGPGAAKPGHRLSIAKEALGDRRYLGRLKREAMRVQFEYMSRK